MRLILILFVITIISAYLSGIYKIFIKANEKGWKALIPIYNITVLLKILGKPKWFIIFFIVPIISDLVFPYTLILTYHRFGYRKFWKILVGVIFSFIFIPYLGFSKNKTFQEAILEKYNFRKDIKIWAYSIVFSLASILLVKGINIFWFQNYKLPTGAMEETLLIGDHISVNKFKVGARLPITPLSLPFYQHTIPIINKPSFIKSWQLPYIRLGKSPNINRDDILVFNFPVGDTVVLHMQTQDYYGIVRGYSNQFKQMNNSDTTIKSDEDYYNMARQYIWENFDITSRPIDRQDVYLKRCVALPGDSLEIINGDVFINSRIQNKIENLQYKYHVKTNKSFNSLKLEELGIANNDIKTMSGRDSYLLLTEKQVESLNSFSNVLSIEPLLKSKGLYSNYIFPFDAKFDWNEDNFGPLYIPKKGDQIDLNTRNLPLYKRIITAYEGNELTINGNIIILNGKEINTYTFKMNYYFMMGDNRHDSADSRYWGLVPESHIIGKASFIWWSKKDIFDIRWERIFMKIK